MAMLCSQLANRGHSVTLVTLEDGRSDRHQVDSKVRRRFFKSPASSRNLLGLGALLRVRRRQASLASLILETDPEVVVSFCDRMNLDVLAGLSKTSRGRSLPTVVCERSDPSRQDLGVYWERVRRRLYPHAAAVVALTEASADFLRPMSKQVFVIPSAVRKPEAFSDRGFASGYRLVVAAGRLAPEKRFDRLIDAFHEALGSDPSWRLTVFGDGPLRQSLLEQAASLGLGDRIKLPGWTTSLDQEISKATCLCLSSEYEGFPSVLLEAMSLGVPVLSVDCDSGPREIIEHGVNGLLVEPSTRGLTEGLQRFASDELDRERMAQAGRSVTERYGITEMIRQFESVLEEAIAAPKRTEPII